MRVLQILYSGLGGHGSVAFTLSSGVQRKGDESVLGFVGVEELLPHYKIMCREQSIPYSFFRWVPGRPVLIWLKIILWLKRAKPDVVIVHSGGVLPACFIYSLLARVPVIFVEHQANSMKSRSQWLITRLGMVAAHKVIYLTDKYAEEVGRTLGRSYRREKVSVIPNGIDVHKYKCTSRDLLASGQVVFGMAARFTNRRRQDLLVECLEVLSLRFSDTNWVLALAGDGVEYSRIERMIHDKGLDGKVILSGSISEDEMVDWFHSIDIYVHATDGETLSTSMLQAMSCGLPVVASKVDGVPGLIGDDGRFGILVNKQDTASFCEAIVNIARSQEAANSLGKNARRLVVDKFSQGRMVERYFSEIKEVVR